MNLGGLTTLARYRPRNLVHVVFDNESLLVGRRIPDRHVDRQRPRRHRGRRRRAADRDRPHGRRVHRRVRRGAGRRRPHDDRRQGRRRRAQGLRHRSRRCSKTGSRFSAICARHAHHEHSVCCRSSRQLNRGTLRVVDLTQPLGPATPVIGLPPIFAPSPGVTIDVISRYDDKGPAWYWNTLTLGEHTGHAFRCAGALGDGEGPARERVRHDPGAALRRAGLRDRRDRRCRGESRLPADAGAHRGMGARARADPAGRVGAAADRLEPAKRCGRVSQRRRRWSAQPRVRRARLADAGSRSRHPRRRRRDDRHRRRDRPVASIRRFRITRSCTARASSASRASATSISCRRPAPSSSPRRSRSSAAAAVRCA